MNNSKLLYGAAVIGAMYVILVGSSNRNSVQRPSTVPGPQADRGSGTNAGSVRPGVMTMAGAARCPDYLAQYGVVNRQIPTNWARHQLSYPRTPCPQIQQMVEVPVNSPAIPKRDLLWMYPPPADEDI